MADFDVKRVSTLEWTGIGAGALAFIVSFFPWFSASYGSASESWSAWSIGFLGFFPVLLLMVAGGLVLAPHFGVKVERLPIIWLSVSGAAVLLILLRWVTMPDNYGLLVADIEMGAGFGLILGLLIAIGSTVAAFLNFRATQSPATGRADAAPAA